jgi:hypothetical protein
MELVVSRPERELLLRLLDKALGDTRAEVRRTRNPTWHDGLKNDESLLRGLIEKIRGN